jgi:hypothetical protein
MITQSAPTARALANRRSSKTAGTKRRLLTDPDPGCLGTD